MHFLTNQWFNYYITIITPINTNSNQKLSKLAGSGKKLIFRFIFILEHLIWKSSNFKKNTFDWYIFTCRYSNRFLFICSSHQLYKRYLYILTTNNFCYIQQYHYNKYLLQMVCRLRTYLVDKFLDWFSKWFLCKFNFFWMLSII